MGSKTLFALVLLLASVLVLSAEVAPKDVDKKFYENDGNLDTNEVDDMKYYRGGWGRGYGGDYGGGYGGGWGRGYGGWRGRGYCPYGCCGWSYYGGHCRQCCYYPGEHVDAHTHAAQPRN